MEPPKVEMDKPNVVISRCINIEAVRYDGGIIRDAFAERLGKYVRYIPVCPEVEIGLGVPRATLRIIKEADGLHLVQPATGMDFTGEMNSFAERFLISLRDVDGFLLKSKSPSSGFSGVKIFQSVDKSSHIGVGKGLFALKVVEMFPHLPIEDEGRLHDPEIRNHFLTRLFTLHDFRVLKKRIGGMRDIVGFHTRYKLILMAYSQRKLNDMGRLIANHEHLPVDEVVERYQVLLQDLFQRKASHRSHINILMHALGYFSEKLSRGEKRHFLDLLDKYGNKWIPLTVPLEVMRNYIYRFGNEYLAGQKYFNPYPEELLYQA
ncbi:MAG: YbgA family protein [Chloroflexota bacterium]